MADLDISQLPAASGVSDADLLLKWDALQASGQRTQKVTVGQLIAVVAGRIPVGPAGAKGPATTLYAGTTSTGAPGSQAIVSVTGAAPNQYLNITVPQGPKGDTGAPGTQGPQGIAGPQGATGLKGDTGTQGVAGAAGAAGPQGAVGPAGAAGPAGQKGDAGAVGPSGAAGQTGPQGAAGATGSAGPQGPKGDTGAAGAQGPAGPQGAQGVPGVQGPQGAQGPKGDKGDTGPQGAQGVPGTGAGNVNTSGTPRTGAFAVYSDTTGNSIKDGGIPAAVATSGSASDLASGTLPTARLPALTGDVTSSAGSAATTLATSGVTAGSYGATNTVPVLTVDAKGRVTAASTATTGTVSSVALAVPTRQTVTGSPVTSNGTISIADNAQAAATVFAGPASGANAAPTFRALAGTDLPSSGVTAGSYTLSSVTVDATGRLTAASSASVTGTGAVVQAGSPALSGTPTAPTPATADSSTTLATTAFVKGQGYTTSSQAAAAAPVQSVAGRTGAVTLAVADVSGAAPLASPAFTGTPTVPTAATGTSTTQAASTAFVATAVSGVSGGAPSSTISLSANYTAAAADKGKAYLLGGSATLNLSSVAVAGWYAWVKKTDGSGAWTISTPGYVIDGLGSIQCYQESYLIWWDNASGTFRTQGRPKGWIPIGNTTSAAAAAAISFTTGFADAELRDMEFAFDNVVASASDYPVIRVQKAGSYLSSGYSAAGFAVGNSTSASNTFSSSVPITFNNATGAVQGRSVIYSFQAASTQRIYNEGFNTTEYWTTGTQTGTSGAVQGLQIIMNGGSNINSGATISQRGFRP